MKITKLILSIAFLTLLFACHSPAESTDVNSVSNHSDSEKTKKVKHIKEKDDILEVKKETESKKSDKKGVNKTKSKENKEESKKQEDPAKTQKNIENKTKEPIEKTKNKKSWVTEKLSGEYMATLSLNIREGPSLDSKVIGYLDPYHKVTATAKATNGGIVWYKVTYKGIEGWSSSNYIKPYVKKEIKREEKKVSQKQTKKYAASTIYFNGKSVPYKNGGQANGQAIIDGGVYASTWGGATTFSGKDGKNTHLIGHNPGVFSGIHTAKDFIITDSSGNPFRYKATKVYKVDAQGIGISDGKNYYNRIAGASGGERVVFQSTYKHPIKWIVEAVPY